MLQSLLIANRGEIARRIIRTARRLGVRTDSLFSSPDFRTFTYCKPMLMSNEGPPVELNRLDSKNWSPTPESVRQTLANTTA
jgi:hypothetical protein